MSGEFRRAPVPLSVEFRSVPRATLPAKAWDWFVENDPQGWWFHTEAFIEYALAYTPGSRDGSVAIVGGGRYLVGVIPGTIGSDDVAVFGGQPFPAPLISKDLAVRQQAGGHPTLRTCWRPGDHQARDLCPGFVQWEGRTRVIDLRPTEAELWQGLRRSYRALIHRVDREYDVDVFSYGTEDQGDWRMTAAHQLHVDMTGRETRPQATWDCQRRWLGTGRGVIVSASQDGQMKAFAYFVRYKRWAYYFSSVASRPSLQHALIWHGMRCLKADGATDHLELGHDWGRNATPRDKGINFFLAGFGGTGWPVDMVVGA